MSEHPRILFSARDPGGAGHIAALAAAFRQTGRFSVSVAASGPALDMLRQLGETPDVFTFSGGQDFLGPGDNTRALLDAARSIMAKHRPDAVVVSLSSLGVGIDEALLAVAGTPTLAIQDFWGDVNLGLGTPAGLYLVMDEYAVDLTASRWGVKAEAIGSPKHARYAELDIPAMRNSARLELSVNLSRPLIGFFGQPPSVPGHEDAFGDLLKALTDFEPSPVLVLREHPKAAQNRKEHMAMAAGLGLDVRDTTDRGLPEDWLAACDVVVTPFSLCGLDHAYLSRYSPEPLGTVLYLNTNHEIRAFIREACAMDCFPTVKQGLGRVADDPAGLREALAELLSPEARGAYFQASASLGGQDPCLAAITAVERALGLTGLK